MYFHFAEIITKILTDRYHNQANELLNNSPLIRYLLHKTRSATKNSKSRASFANLYAIYVLVEDYVQHNFHTEGDYSQYKGVPYQQLATRQCELPFGKTLQNHALNNRTNAEFQKFSPQQSIILRNLTTKHYWINEKLLNFELNGHSINIAPAILEIIRAYIEAKQHSFNEFLQTIEDLKSQSISLEDKELFIQTFLLNTADARLFEIVSYAILKVYYGKQVVYLGITPKHLQKEKLLLYKTGKTNANDGGIDFVMKPLGRFFQVTETLNVKKFFLDIDKVQKYPITFVVKSNESIEIMLDKLLQKAKTIYTDTQIIDKYMSCIEELINIPKLNEMLNSIAQANELNEVLEEISIQSKLELC